MKITIQGEMMYAKNIINKLEFDYSECNLNEENRIKTATTIAAISRGKDGANNPSKRYQSLLKEAAGNILYSELLNEPVKRDKAPGRPLEYIKVALYLKENDDSYIFKDSNGGVVFTLFKKDCCALEKLAELFRFSNLFAIGDNIKVISNIRALLNLGIEYSDIPYNTPDELLGYYVCEVEAPYFVFAQLRTHGQLSQVAVSGRVIDEDNIWLPEDIVERMQDNLSAVMTTVNNYHKIEYTTQAIDKFMCNPCIGNVLHFLNELKPIAAKEALKAMGYHKEIANRWPNMLQLKRWIIGGMLGDKFGWGHMLLEREVYPKQHSSWTQETTKETVNLINESILKYIGSKIDA